MPMPVWDTVTVTVTRPAWVGSRGTMVPDWDNATAVEVPGCWVGNPATSADATATSRPALSRATLYLPPTADVREGDRVTYAGADYALDGAPLAFPSPFGGIDHYEVPLVDWS